MYNTKSFIDMRYWWLGTRPWHTIHNLAPWVDLLLFASFAPFKICTIWLIILFPYPVDGHMYPSFVLFQSFSLFYFDFQFFLFCASYTFCASPAVARPISFFEFVSPIFLFDCVAVSRSSLITHSTLQLNYLPSSGHYKSHFIWRCDGDLLQWNLMFSLDIYTSDSHLDSAIWINTSETDHVQ